MLAHQLTLALHHTSTVLQHKSHVHHPLKVLKVLGFQSIGQSIIQTIQEILLLISIYLIGSIARELGEPVNILID
jgi:hypothetical protein